MSAACPFMCCDVLDPFSAAFRAGDLYPLLTRIGLPYAFRSGSSTLLISCFRFSNTSGVGSLLIFFAVAVVDAVSS